jgi:hypothetical protein
MDAPQVFEDTANGAAAAMLAKLSVTLIRLVTVTVFALLVVPEVTVPKFSEVEENVTGAPPVPVRFRIF